MLGAKIFRRPLFLAVSFGTFWEHLYLNLCLILQTSGKVWKVQSARTILALEKVSMMRRDAKSLRRVRPVPRTQLASLSALQLQRLDTTGPSPKMHGEGWL